MGHILSVCSVALLIVDLEAPLPVLPVGLFLVVLFHLQLLRAYKFSQILAEGRKGSFKTLTVNPERNHFLILAYCGSKAVVSQEANMDYSLQKL